jgi:hypothetical protein
MYKLHVRHTLTSYTKLLGPSHEERERLRRREGRVEVWERKGSRNSRWKGADCGVM